jgi:hypothetical protein
MLTRAYSIVVVHGISGPKTWVRFPLCSFFIELLILKDRRTKTFISKFAIKYHMICNFNWLWLWHLQKAHDCWTFEWVSCKLRREGQNTPIYPLTHTEPIIRKDLDKVHLFPIPNQIWQLLSIIWDQLNRGNQIILFKRMVFS